MNAEEFKREWLSAFARGISKKELERHVTGRGGYVWHIFCAGLAEEGSYLVGDAAREAYRKAKKDGAIYIEPFLKKAESVPLCVELYEASALERLTEVYVVGKGFKWTYVKTHEGDWCGPYFYKKPTEYI